MKPRRNNDPESSALEEVRSVYRDLAQRPAERNCELRTECCQFKLTGLVPYLTRGEALVAAKGVRATGRRTMPVRDDGACPMLDGKTGKCMIYEHRPFGCRTHFCRAAGGPRSRKEVIDLIRRLEAVDVILDGAGPRPLEAAVAAELARLH